MNNLDFNLTVNIRAGDVNETITHDDAPVSGNQTFDAEVPNLNQTEILSTPINKTYENVEQRNDQDVNLGESFTFGSPKEDSTEVTQEVATPEVLQSSVIEVEKVLSPPVQEVNPLTAVAPLQKAMQLQVEDVSMVEMMETSTIEAERVAAYKQEIPPAVEAQSEIVRSPIKASEVKEVSPIPVKAKSEIKLLPAAEAQSEIARSPIEASEVKEVSPIPVKAKSEIKPLPAAEAQSMIARSSIEASEVKEVSPILVEAQSEIKLLPAAEAPSEIASSPIEASEVKAVSPIIGEAPSEIARSSPIETSEVKENLSVPVTLLTPPVKVTAEEKEILSTEVSSPDVIRKSPPVMEQSFKNIDEISHEKMAVKQNKEMTVSSVEKNQQSPPAEVVKSSSLSKSSENVFVEKMENPIEVQFKMPSAPVFKQSGVPSDEEFKCGSSCKNILKSTCVRSKTAFTNT